ncbi:hypothetical protein LWI29_020772 [Acer saccharum]|uniref:Uncharacterized protein n=1 Tax=Acer saccharum TaxID=4024 RepID=A0AA39T8J4_ACESA|nr:hypothetical protein LWI29_020772 [Acer saccharum]
MLSVILAPVNSRLVDQATVYLVLEVLEEPRTDSQITPILRIAHRSSSTPLFQALNQEEPTTLLTYTEALDYTSFLLWSYGCSLFYHEVN